MKIVTILPETLNDFRDTWPCHGLYGIDHIVLCSHGGDLVDLQAYSDSDGVTETEVDADGQEALAALTYCAIRDAKEVPVYLDGQRVDSTWQY